MGRLTHRTGPGFTYFVTTKTWQGRSVFQVPEIADILTETLMRYRENSSYSLHEFVVMPNHLHLLITPAVDTSLERAMQLIKGGSSHTIHQRRETKSQIWQPGFHEENVRDETDYQRKVEYIRMNPVQAHLADKPEEWAYGSATGKFKMDPMPKRLSGTASGAKAR